MINETPIHELNETLNDNRFYIKREDMIPYSFGGNKYRKAVHYFNKIIEEGYDTVITTGGSSSNHCRIIANMAKEFDIECHVLFTSTDESKAFNRQMIASFDTVIHQTTKDDLDVTVEALQKNLAEKGNKALFIPSGGHGLLGTKAYHEAYEEIMAQAKANNVHFDYIFFASGTGTTEAGLRAGRLLGGEAVLIYAISVVRSYDEGAPIIQQSVNRYFEAIDADVRIHKPDIHFIDRYLKGGYTYYDEEIESLIDHVMKTEGIPLDPVYTAKAYNGMLKTVKKEKIKNKNILFIHTGGTPIYFDYLRTISKK